MHLSICFSHVAALVVVFFLSLNVENSINKKCFKIKVLRKKMKLSLD